MAEQARPVAATTTGVAPRFQAGGTVREASIYVERAADQELFEIMNRGEFCYVLAPRQIGKSSLRLRAEKRLVEQGVTVVSIDLTAIGTSELRPDTWLYSLASLIADDAHLDLDLDTSWGDGPRLSPIQRWSRFLRKELLSRIPGRIAIFIDEIDAVFGLPFPTDDFFGSIRELYNARAGEPACARLTFCLIGLATPSTLMRDAARTPFNIGHAVAVTDFTRPEADALLPGLARAGDDAEALLNAVYAWTSGHPYMTLRVCDRVVNDPPRDGEDVEARVARLVHEVFVSRGRVEDANLMYAERYLARQNEGAKVTAMLFLYRRLLEGQDVVSDPNSSVEAHLRLSGVAAPRRVFEDEPRRLLVRNRIFQQVFSLPWVREKERALLSSELVQRWLAAAPEARRDFVLRGRALEEALGVALTRDDVSAQEEAFLRESQEVAREDEEARRDATAKAQALDRERIERAEEQRKRAEEQQRSAEQKVIEARRNALGLSGLSVILLAMLGVSTYLFRDARVARERAEEETRKEKEATLRAEDARTRLNVALAHEKDAALIEQGKLARVLAERPGREMEALLLGIKAVAERDADPARTLPATVDGLVRGLMPARLLGTLEGHTRSVIGVAFSPDGARLLTASTDGTARLWDLHDNRTLVTLGGRDGNSDELRAAVFSPDGQRIATAGNDRAARIWSAETGALLASLLAHTDAVTSVAFSPDGERVLTASNDKTARLWDAQTGRVIAPLKGHGLAVNMAAFSPDGSRIVTASADRTARLWSGRDGALLAVLRGHGGPVEQAVFSPDGTRIATASEDTTGRIWSAVDGKPLALLQGHTQQIFSITFSPDGERLVTGSGDTTARLWDGHDGHAFPLFQETSAFSFPISSAIFSPDGTEVVTTSWDHNARVWSVRGGSPRITFDSHTGSVRAAAFSPDGTRLATASDDLTARIWDVRAGKPLFTLRGNREEITALAFMPDSAIVLTGGADHQVRRWKAGTGDPLGSLDAHGGAVTSLSVAANGSRVLTGGEDGSARLADGSDGRSIAVLRDRASPITTVALSPDGAVAVTGSADGSAHLWDARLGAEMPALIGHTARVNSASFAPDGARAVTASDDGTAIVWDTQSGAALTTFRLHHDAVTAAAFSADGARVGTASADETARIWLAASGELVATYLGHTGPIEVFAFSPDGALAATGGRDRTARLWNARTGALITTLGTHEGTVRALSFSPDGTRLATGSDDTKLRLWDVKTGEPLATLEGATAAVRVLAFSPDGETIAAGGADGTARIYAATARGFLAQACRFLQPLRADLKDPNNALRACKPYVDEAP